MDSLIKSRENRNFKYILSLNEKKIRDASGSFMIEGEKFVQEAMKACEIELIAVSQTYFEKTDRPAFWENDADVKVLVFSDNLFKEMSNAVTAQGVLAVCSHPKTELDGVFNILSENAAPLFVLLEEISDPGNLGTIIRTADAAGASAVILSKGCADLYSPKVLRSTAGSAFHLPIVCGADLSCVVSKLKKLGISCVAAHLGGAAYPYGLDLAKGCAFIIGNEARGLSREITKEADTLVKIPIPGKAESLNAAVACGILLYEAVRQRRNYV